MENLVLLALITGLTTGGLSCFAVQGGLITGSVAHRLEAVVKTNRPAGAKRTSRKAAANANAAQPTARPRTGQALLLFLGAKLVAYTLLGLLLGALGSVLTLSPLLKGGIQVLIGVFIVGNALRMMDVHPIFRYFSFEPPSRVTRWIRRISKRDEQWSTPVFLGALTVLIPCGITQSMMALAVGTGSPILGAGIMFFFTLGTGPTFLAVTWLATSLSSIFQKSFYRVVAILVLALGLYTTDTGIVAMGSPVSLTRYFSSFGTPQVEQVVSPGDQAVIQVVNWGYTPTTLTLPAGEPVELRLVTNQTRSCSRAFTIPALNVQRLLPETGEVIVEIPPQRAGTSLQFACSMGMYGGRLVFK
jgi:uncharacterized protein